MAKKKTSKVQLSRLSALDIGYENNGIVKWGRDNTAPQKLLELIEESNTQKQCTQIVIDSVIAGGLSGPASAALPRFANNFGESYNEIFERIVDCDAALNGFAIEVVWDNGTVSGESEPRISEILHVPIAELRFAPKNERGMITHWLRSNRWANKTGGFNQSATDNAEVLPVFNPMAVSGLDKNNNAIIILDADGKQIEKPKQRKQILVVSKYNRLADYPVPSWASAERSIRIDSDVKTFKESFIDTSIVASSIVQVQGSGSSKFGEDLLDDIENYGSGAQNAGTKIVTEVQDGNFHQFGSLPNVKGAAETYNSYEEKAQSEIILANGLYREILDFDSGGGGLNFAAQFSQKYQTFLNTTVRVRSGRILSGVDRLAPYLDGIERFEITPINLLEGTQEEVVAQDNVNSNEGN